MYSCWAVGRQAWQRPSPWRLGHEVLLLTRPDQSGDKIGESLAPAATPMLHQLGVWERFVTGGHLPCYGNQSCWGSAELRHYDFINDPNGNGWHIDRPLFERQLMEEATTLGVQQTRSVTLHSATRVQDRWQVKLRSIDKQAPSLSAIPDVEPCREHPQMRTGGGAASEDAPYTSAPYTDSNVKLGIVDNPPLLTAKFVVDATGRSSWFARRQGAQRLVKDRQVALVTFLQPTGAPLVDTTTLVEAVNVGWWYSARIPDGRMVTMLMTDHDLIDRQLPNDEAWRQLLADALYTAARVEQHGYQPSHPPYLVAAESGRLNQLWGEGWVAVGDTAMSYDPLAAHGLTLALAGGRDAALAITAQLAGQPDALAAYAWRLESAYTHYLSRRQAYYRAETRWPTAPYWTRRTLGAQA